MQNTILKAVTLFALLSLPQAVSAGSITYYLLSNPELYGGLSGSITTDGTGYDPTITSWTLTLTESDGKTYTANSNYGAFNQLDGVYATSTELILEFPGVTGPGGETNTSNFDLGSRFDGSTFDMEYIGYAGPYPGLVEVGGSIENVPVGGGVYTYGDFVIAATTVPEPSAVYLLGIGASCVSVYVMGRRRRERSDLA